LLVSARKRIRSAQFDVARTVLMRINLAAQIAMICVRWRAADLAAARGVTRRRS
jgi:hypothetical protein